MNDELDLIVDEMDESLQENEYEPLYVEYEICLNCGYTFGHKFIFSYKDRNTSRIVHCPKCTWFCAEEYLVLLDIIPIIEEGVE